MSVILSCKQTDENIITKSQRRDREETKRRKIDRKKMAFIIINLENMVNSRLIIASIIALDLVN